jgi:hypothetical protein
MRDIDDDQAVAKDRSQDATDLPAGQIEPHAILRNPEFSRA